MTDHGDRTTADRDAYWKAQRINERVTRAAREFGWPHYITVATTVFWPPHYEVHHPRSSSFWTTLGLNYSAACGLRVAIQHVREALAR